MASCEPGGSPGPFDLDLLSVAGLTDAQSYPTSSENCIERSHGIGVPRVFQRVPDRPPCLDQSPAGFGCGRPSDALLGEPLPVSRWALEQIMSLPVGGPLGVDEIEGERFAYQRAACDHLTSITL